MKTRRPQKPKMNKHLKPHKRRNFVAKHSHDMCGAGLHVEKKGDRAPRNRQKHDWKKEESNE